MKAIIKKFVNINIDLEIDKSEAVMFNQGGAYKVDLQLNDLLPNEILDMRNEFNKINITLLTRISKDHLGEFNRMMKDHERNVWKPEELDESGKDK